MLCERLHGMQEVESSILFGSNSQFIIARVGQTDRNEGAIGLARWRKSGKNVRRVSCFEGDHHLFSALP